MLLRERPDVHDISSHGKMPGEGHLGAPLITVLYQGLLDPVKVCLIFQIEGNAGVKERLSGRYLIHEGRDRQHDNCPVRLGNRAKDPHALHIEKVARDVCLVKKKVLCGVQQCIRLEETQILVGCFGGEVIFRDHDHQLCSVR